MVGTSTLTKLPKCQSTRATLEQPEPATFTRKLQLHARYLWKSKSKQSNKKQTNNKQTNTKTMHITKSLGSLLLDCYKIVISENVSYSERNLCPHHYYFTLCRSHSSHLPLPAQLKRNEQLPRGYRLSTATT